MKTIQRNLAVVKQFIAAAEAEYHRIVGSVTLVAVSKAQSVEKIRAAISCGQFHFGENYLQEALPKIKALQHHDIVWHYIGRVQSNKTKLIAQNFSWVETIANYHTADLLNKYRPIDCLPLNVCIQVNVGSDINRVGVLPKDLLQLAKKIIQLPKLKLRGLMTIPRHCKEFADQLKIFNELQDTFKNLQQHGVDIDTVSMGMSNDFKAAIASGATIVRIGTAIFGERGK